MREKPSEVCRKAARLYKASRTMERVLGEGAVEAITGRYVICANSDDPAHDGTVIAQLPFGTECPIVNMQAIETIFGREKAEDLRREIC